MDVYKRSSGKVDRVAALIAYPPPANSTTMLSSLVCQDRIVCLDWNSIFAQSGKIAVIFEPMMLFKILYLNS